MLAVLAAHPDRHVRADTLIDGIWGASPPPTAAKTLRSYVSRLRAVMGSSIVTSRAGLCLRTSDIRLDSAEFENRVSSAKLLAPRAAADTLRSALDLWHGAAFGDMADIEAVSVTARALEQLKVGARQQLADALLRSADLSRPSRKPRAARRAPLDEYAWETLIRALSASGRTADALAAYRRAYEELSNVGLEPSERLQRAQRGAFDAATAVPAPPTWRRPVKSCWAVTKISRPWPSLLIGTRW